MTRIVFREEALQDLQDIIAWYEGVAPEATPRILTDIFRSLDQLSRYPLSGMEVVNRSIRRIVTLRYHFKIAYEVNDDQVTVLGIFRYQDRQV